MTVCTPRVFVESEIEVVGDIGTGFSPGFVFEIFGVEVEDGFGIVGAWGVDVEGGFGLGGGGGGLGVCCFGVLV